MADTGPGPCKVDIGEVVLFGDSITQQSFSVGGWGARLADYFQRRADVMNRGFSGYNTAWALRVMDGMFKKMSKVELVIVFFGANDGVKDGMGPTSRQFVPVEKYGENLEKIVQEIRSQAGSETRILLLTPPPTTRTDERINDNTKRYAVQAGKTAAKLGLPSLDLHTNMTALPDWEGFFRDGLHLSPKGNEVVYDLLISAVEAAYPDLAVARCPHTGSTGNAGARSSLTHYQPFHGEFSREEL
eukprot:TRINITY_DN7914_c0_g1_i3.p1 TRINITY_DN7914_c0_g1~~TRINITY_DN7914_c0_g1_i3.p1  ORF type:complete len:244 (+),score=37.50 TRINITY_DN7914_c0_g1_i3:226-957(+)